MKVISVDGIAASAKTISDGSYPISRTLFVVTRGYPSGPTSKFVNFLRSNEGQSILAREGKIIALAN